MPPQLRAYWTRGAGAAKIRWAQPGDFKRCVKQVIKEGVPVRMAHGACANLHKEALGVWPGQEGKGRKGHTAGWTDGVDPDDIAEDLLEDEADLDDGITHAGLLLKADDTGRWLMLQRGLDDADPNSGLWEFPGGGIEDDESPLDAAVREFSEECGAPIPDGCDLRGATISPRGNYVLFLATVPTEADYPIDRVQIAHSPDCTASLVAAHVDIVAVCSTCGEQTAYTDVINPDDPDGDVTEAIAWWDPEHVIPGGYHVRPEVLESDFDLIQGALSPSLDLPDIGEIVAALATATGADQVGDDMKKRVITAAYEDDATAAEVDAAAAEAEAEAAAEAEANAEALPSDVDPTDARILQALANHHEQMIIEIDDFIEAHPDSKVIPELQEHAAEADSFVLDVLARLGQEPAEEAAEEAAEDGMEMEMATEEDALVASIASVNLVKPPDEWFEPFDLGAPTPITITADGRVYGHLADWKSCHRSPALQAAGQCVKPPSDPNPAFFYSGGQVLTASGNLIDVGRLTVGGGHADVRKGIVAALEHYDDASTVGAVVRVHEDEHGIGLFGSVVADATPQQVAALRRSPFSGDWRKERGRYRLVAAHAVNTGGYPIPRELGLVASVTDNTFITTGRVKCSACDEEHSVPDSLIASVVSMVDAEMQAARNELRDSLVASISVEPDLQAAKRELVASMEMAL